MKYAVVKGTVVATQKVKELTGVTLKVLHPSNAKGELTGDAFVAADPIGCRSGDHVMWVEKREASLVFPEAKLKNNFPVDAAITGIIDAVG